MEDELKDVLEAAADSNEGGNDAAETTEKEGKQPTEAKKVTAPKTKDAPAKEAAAPKEAEKPKFQKPKAKPGQLLMVHKTRKDKQGNPLYRSVTLQEVKGFEKNGFVLDAATAAKQ